MKRLFFLGLTLLVSGCQKLNFLQDTAVWLHNIDISAEKDSNDATPILFHIIFIYDKETEKVFLEKKSRDYFEEYKQIKRDLADKIDVFEFYVIPGRTKNNIPLDSSKYAVASALAFARYTNTDANQRQNIEGKHATMKFTFKKDKFEMQSLDSTAQKEPAKK